MKKQKSLINHMYQRSAMSLGKKGGENPVRKSLSYPKEEIKGKKNTVEPIKELSAFREGEEEDRKTLRLYEGIDQGLRNEYEKRLNQRDFENLKKREAALGGPKKVSKKIQRREKFKKALNNTIMFLGSK
jgi:hypothetical protein